MPKTSKSDLKNKNLEKTKKVPRDLVETFPKRVHNPKSKKNCAVQVPGRTDVRTYVRPDILHPYGKKTRKEKVSRNSSTGATTTKATVTKLPLRIPRASP